jgi:NodT family efflux transporter outer membrane factor (OMF) lipoprotein
MQGNFRITTLAISLSTIVLASCAVGPDYKRPETAMPQQYKAAIAQDSAWKVAVPRDDAPRGDWWEIYGDAQLDALVQQLNETNQNVAAAEARYRQAQATARAASAAYFPVLGANASKTRRGSGAPNTVGNTINTGGVGDDYSASLDASWELDLWGRIRRDVEASDAGVQASAADLAAARLSAQAQLAQNYFLLRIADAQQELLDRTVEDYRKSLQLTNNQYAAGVASRAEVMQAETQLKATQAQAVDNGVQRAQLENAIAILLGKAPVDVVLPSAPPPAQLPVIPAEVPSQLLERRPDIAAAERRTAAANAEIGVAQAAYFPTLSLSASGGYQNSSFADWFSAPNRFWSVGPVLAQTLFDGGLRSANKQRAVAAYDETVATYRQTVLTGLQEVEDNLVALDLLRKELEYQEDAVRAARAALQLVNNQYKAGTVGYLNVITAETAALDNERNLLQVRGRQFTASVLLIKALGGGWHDLAADDAVAR